MRFARFAGREGHLGHLKSSSKAYAVLERPNRGLHFLQSLLRRWHSRTQAITQMPHSIRHSITGLQPSFGNSSAQEAKLAILGDLHLEPDQMRLFHKARQQVNSLLCEELTGRALACAGVIQLGDVGGYNYQPGSRGCFETAKEYLKGFKVPYALITGNHDLEGNEFETDEDNLNAWTEVFEQRHFWTLDAGPLLCIGLSTVRFRSNQYSAHEVHIDDQQLTWFEEQLRAAGGRPVAVFTHAPAMGSGLKAVLDVHVKNRCAWINHSTNPEAFLQLVHRYPNIRLWFSGHYHLSHNYPDSISTDGSCAFVNTGVIGNGNRDGCRHSRILEVSREGFELFTLDHEEGGLRLDLRRPWHEPSRTLSSLSAASTDSAAGDTAQQDASRRAAGGEASASGLSNGARRPDAVQWYDIGRGRLLARHPRLLCEYDAALLAPMGAVFLDMSDSDTLVFLDEAGQALDLSQTPAGVPADCRTAAHIQLRSASTAGIREAARNSEGAFYTIFQHNKWRLRKDRERLAAAGHT